MHFSLYRIAIASSLTGAVLAQSPTSSPASEPTCTASLVTRVCDYKDPGPEFAVAIESRASCWQYCNSHQPCDFTIFAPGNPTLGSGNCWLYPGEQFDAGAATTDCGNTYLEVYGKPECSGGTPTTGGCAATASPSAVAQVCGYPTPPDNCFNSCTASGGAVNCLSQCVEAESCSYVVFNPHNPTNSPFGSGTCWMYSNGTFNAGSATTCTGAPEQYAYENPCPKPPPSSSSNSPSSSSASASGSGSATGAGGAQAAGAAASSSGSAIVSQNSASVGASATRSLFWGVFALLLWSLY